MNRETKTGPARLLRMRKMFAVKGGILEEDYNYFTRRGDENGRLACKEHPAAAHTETLDVRSFDLLHVGMAVALGATEFLTFDARQAALAKASGLKVKPGPASANNSPRAGVSPEWRLDRA